MSLKARKVVELKSSLVRSTPERILVVNELRYVDVEIAQVEMLDGGHPKTLIQIKGVRLKPVT